MSPEEVVQKRFEDLFQKIPPETLKQLVRSQHDQDFIEYMMFNQEALRMLDEFNAVISATRKLMGIVRVAGVRAGGLTPDEAAALKIAQSALRLIGQEDV